MRRTKDRATPRRMPRVRGCYAIETWITAGEGNACTSGSRLADAAGSLRFGFGRWESNWRTLGRRNEEWVSNKP
jgi:hypothetical protein